MDSNRSFHDLIGRLQQGDEAASAEFVRLYETELRRFVRYRLSNPRIRRFLDSIDVCQSVFAKFFVRIADGQYEFSSPRQLIQLLQKMATNKLLDHQRRTATVRHGGGLKSLAGEAVDQVADPVERSTSALEMRELVDLVRGQLSAEEQALLDRWMHGDDWNVIAKDSGASADAVRKRLMRAIDRAATELGLGEAL
jgi:RNA polymerase sigma factor (sigma-70 family)